MKDNELKEAKLVIEKLKTEKETIGKKLESSMILKTKN
jgi:hypothetical protein